MNLGVTLSGIDQLDPKDLRYASELGYRIKLLAVARLRDNDLELHVSPTLVRRGRPSRRMASTVRLNFSRNL